MYEYAEPDGNGARKTQQGEMNYFISLLNPGK